MKRSFFVSCAALVPLIACGDSGNDGDDEPTIIPEGEHYGYVVSKAYVPITSAQASDWGLDLASAKTGKPDGLIDNVLGLGFGTLSGYGFDVQGTITTAINEGTIMLLVDFQTEDFTTASASGLTVKIGATSTPLACASPSETDTQCRHHLDGNASFTIATSSPSSAGVAGAIVGGTFNGGPGDLSLQIAVGTTQPIQLTLHNARAKATAITATGMTAIIGGALTQTDLNTQVVPAIQGTIAGILDTGCGATRQLPACGCTTAGTKTILNLFDTAPKDCAVSLSEILDSNIIKAVLMPDVCSTKTCAAPDALSLGIKVDAVTAKF